jgi:hypothetical protein
MSRIHAVLTLSLGGVIWGSLLGVFGGALAGGVYGAISGDISRGLDGAILGGVVLAIGGAVYGAILGFASEQANSEFRCEPPNLVQRETTRPGGQVVASARMLHDIPYPSDRAGG